VTPCSPLLISYKTFKQAIFQEERSYQMQKIYPQGFSQAIFYPEQLTDLWEFWRKYQYEVKGLKQRTIGGVKVASFDILPSSVLCRAVS
jgi:hypothetical protein